MAEGKDQEICELKGKIVALEHKLRDFEYVMDQAMDNYIVFLKTQDAAITSYVKPPKTSKTLKSFMDDLIDKLVTMDSKIKDQAKSLHDAMCTNIEMEKKQKNIEDKISDMLTYSSLQDIKNMLKQLVIKHDYLMVPGLDFVTPKQMDLSACQLGVPIVNTISVVTFNPIKIEAVDHVEAPSIVVDTDITVEQQDTSMLIPSYVTGNKEIQSIITEIPLHDRLVDESYNIDDLDRLDQDNHNTDDLDRLDQYNDNTNDVDRLDQDNDNSDNVDTDDTEDYEPAKADNCIEGGNIDGELAIKKEIEVEVSKKSSVNVCKWCNKTFKKPSQLKYHILTHTGEKTHECQVCNVMFATTERLKVHTRIHTGEKPYKCLTCGKKFRVNGNYREHKRTHNKDEQIKCDICPASFTKRRLLRLHYSKVHPDVTPPDIPLMPPTQKVSKRVNHVKPSKPSELHTLNKPYECSVCHMKFAGRASLIRHMGIHSGDRPYECTICGRKFNQNGALKIHSRLHNKDEQIKCDICPASFTSRFYLRKHCTKAHPDAQLQDKPRKVKTIPDDINEAWDSVGKIGAQTETPSHKTTVVIDNTANIEVNTIILNLENAMTNIKQHFQENSLEATDEHQEFSKSQKVSETAESSRSLTLDKQYECSECHKKFALPGQLSVHKRIHSGERPYKCLTCGKRFRLSGDYSVHKRIHNKHEQFKCDVCPASFTRKKTLRQHILGRHSVTTPFVCKICGKGFKGKQGLNYHEKRLHPVDGTHIPTKRIKEKVMEKCDICDKFFTRYSLKHHRATHTGNKPHCCEICGESFIQSSNLDYHIKWHKNERNFGCEHCDQRFIRKSDLKKHMNIHLSFGQKKNSYICDICGKLLSSTKTLENHVLLHSSVNEMSCDYCEKTFHSKQSVRDHVRNFHKRQKLECDVCGKVICKLATLKTHKMIHTGEKPHKCKECGVHFRLIGTLKSHMVLHTGQMPFKCEKCELRFKHGSLFYTHRKKCTGTSDT